MANIDRIVDGIKSGKLTQKQLITQFTNVCGYGGISDPEKERLVEAITNQLKVKFPSAAKKMFGSKDAEAREILSQIDINIRSIFDLADSRVKAGVKTGGDMIKGEMYIQVYISYKNPENFGAYLGLEQKTIDDELRAYVARYKTGSGTTGNIEKCNFGLEDQKTFVKIYDRYLREIAERFQS